MATRPRTDLGDRVEALGLGLEVQVCGLRYGVRVWGVGFRVWGRGSGVWGLGLRIQGVWFRVEASGVGGLVFGVWCAGSEIERLGVIGSRLTATRNVCAFERSIDETRISFSGCSAKG